MFAVVVREYDPERTMGDWRSGPRAVPEPSRRPERDTPRERPRDCESLPTCAPFILEGLLFFKLHDNCWMLYILI